MLSALDELVEKIGGLSSAERGQLVETVAPLRARTRFVPLPGPQMQAYLSQADVLLYGGAAGGGKSFLLMGLGAQEHTRAIIFRREASQTDGLEEAGKQIIGDTARFNGQDLEWNWPDGRNLKLSGMKEPGDWMKHAGRERDLIGFDEAGEFIREQVSSLIAWNRGPEGQRCRIVLASNPPRSSDGYWLTEWFAPWLDRQFHAPAAPGELRWAILIDGKPVWQANGDLVEINGELHKPLSFTFVPALLSDNPYRDTPEYRARLNSLPEPLRSQLLYGSFDVGQQDAIDQAIPTEWVSLAQQRWTPVPPVGIPLCAIGVDVAQGGGDQTVIAKRHDGWFHTLEAVPGSETPSGQEVAGKVLSRRYDNAKVIVDLGGGWGGDALAHLVKNGVDATGYMGVKPSTRRTRDGQLKFYNTRTEAWWRFREALDPFQPGGSPISLPNDRELLADLTAPTYQTISQKGGMAIRLESKEDLIKRLKRSPDKGDAVVMCWWQGAKMATDYAEWRTGMTGRAIPKVIMGHAAARRR